MSSSTMAWTSLYHLGDLSLTLPMAGAITVWLLAERAWRAALVWGAVFGLALALVAATKIAFMGWDTGLSALRYQALSGHATGFTAVFPTACYLLTQRYGHQARAIAAGAALALGAVVAAALVHAGEHSPAEAVAGWAIGAGAFLLGVRLAGATPAPVGRATTVALLAFAVSAWAISSLPIGYWMIKLALALSGNHAPYSWDRC
jgi:hypothetical protein